VPTRLFQPQFTGGILGEGMYARTDTTKYTSGVKDAVNMLIRPQGGLQNRPGFRLASGFDTGGTSEVQWLIPFTLTEQATAMLEFSPDGKVRVISEGAYVLDSSFTAETVVAVTEEATARIEMSSSGAASNYSAGQLVFLDDPNGDHALGEQILEVDSVSNEFITFNIYDGSGIDTSAGSGMWGSIGSGAELKPIYEFAHPYDPKDLAFLRFAQDNLDMYIAHPGYNPRVLTFTALDDWAITPQSFGPSIGSTSNVIVTPDSAGSDTETYAVSAIAEDNLEEGVAVEETITNSNLENEDNVVDWNAVSGAVLYNVYRQDAGGLGYIGTTSNTEFRDSNLVPDQSIRPKEARNPFSGVDNHPSVVNFVEQRLAYASTLNEPQLIEMSKTAAPSNFTVSYPSQADDGLRFRLRTRRLNDIRALVVGRALYAFTTSAEWVITGNENEGVLTPSSIVPRPESYYGSFDIEPEVVGDYALFVEPNGNRIRDFLLTLNPNQDQSRDLTILVRDLFEGREVTSWAYAAAPDRVVWVTLDDGSLLTLAYMPEHDIWGWTRHELGGDDPFCYQVAVAREGVVDAAYVVLGRRDAQGAEVVMAERVDKREDDDIFAAFFVDSGLTYFNPGSPASMLSGLLHLRGEEVIALVDGDVVEGLTVDEAGVVDLGVFGEHIHVGLPYQARVQTLPVDFETEAFGSMVGRYKAVGEVAIWLKNSRGIKAGVSLDRLDELKEWTPSLVGGPIPAETRQVNMSVSGDWVRDATVYVVQDYPLPLTVLGIAPDWEPGE
jgi:hypothetical protein